MNAMHAETLPSAVLRPRPALVAVRLSLQVVGIALLLLYLLAAFPKIVPLQGDLRSYVTAGQAAIIGQDPYDPETLHALAGRLTEPFVYPPVALVPFIALTSLGEAAAAAWLVLKLVLLAGLVVLWKTRFVPRASVLAIALIAVFGWNASAMWDLRAGNVAIVEAALLWSAFACFLAGRRAAFAALVVAASCFKILPLIFLLLLLVPVRGRDSNPRRLIAPLVAFVLLVVVPAAFASLRWQPFLASLPSAERLGPANPGLLALFTTAAEYAGLAEEAATRAGTVAWAATLVVLFGISLSVFRQAWRKAEPSLWVMIGVFAYTLVAPRPMAYGFVLLAPVPLFFRPPPFDRPGADLALAFVLAAQGLTRAAQIGSDSWMFVFAPLLLTLSIWLLVVHQARDTEQALSRTKS